MWAIFEKVFRRKPPPKIKISPPPSPIEPSLPTLEIVGLPGHGKTSFLWGLMLMTRKLSLIWPQYLCWSRDTDTEEGIRSLLGAMSRRELPESNGDERIYRVSLKKMERWGEQHLLLKDDRDPVFGAMSGSTPPKREVNWGVPVCWLVSLPDLGAGDTQLVDAHLSDLLRARMRSGRSFETQPLKLVVALTKADRIPNLPPELRRYLRGDPMASLIEAEALPVTGGEGGQNPLPFNRESLERYLKDLMFADRQIVGWLDSTLAGRLLVRRAGDYNIRLRFCLVSATGSDLRCAGHLAIPWSPRRVLDPLFSSLELESR